MCTKAPQKRVIEYSIGPSECWETGRVKEATYVATANFAIRTRRVKEGRVGLLTNVVDEHRRPFYEGHDDLLLELDVRRHLHRKSHSG